MRLAASMPYAPSPKYAMFRYRSRMSCLDSLPSSAVAYFASWILRAAVSAVAAARCAAVRFGSSLSTFRTYCMVSVEAPCETWPLPLLATNARMTALRSTPPCW